MIFWKKYKEIIVILAFLLLMGAVYYFVINRLVVKINNNSNRLRELEATHENQQKRLGSLPKIKRDFEILEESEQKINPFLEKDKAVELIQEVENFAESTNNEVIIEVVAPEVSAKGGAKNVGETIISGLPVKDYIQLRIKATGTFFSLLKLLNKIENSRYYLDVLSLQISRNQNPEKGRPTEVILKNPFGKNDSGENSMKNQGEETISLINVAVYTKN